jgi:ornithine carbamoyltransferase
MTATSYQSLLKEFISLSGELYQKDFLLTWEKSVDELKKIIAVAEALRWLRRENISSRCFDSGLAVSIFRDQSTRTRFSFIAAANLLGLGVQDLDEGRSQIAHGETVRETANMIAFSTEFIGIRDDIFLGAGHTYMQEVAAALDDGFRSGVL